MELTVWITGYWWKQLMYTTKLVYDLQEERGNRGYLLYETGLTRIISWWYTFAIRAPPPLCPIPPFGTPVLIHALTIDNVATILFLFFFSSNWCNNGCVAVRLLEIKKETPNVSTEPSKRQKEIKGLLGRRWFIQRCPRCILWNSWISMKSEWQTI